MSIRRLEYHKNHANAFKIEKLSTLGTDNRAILKYLKHTELDLNSYIKLRENCYVPLIFYFSRSSEYELVMKYFLHKRSEINFSLQPDCDKPESLLFVAHSMYLQELIKAGAPIGTTKQITNSLMKKLLSCEWKRIRMLEKNSMIKPKITQSIIDKPGLMLKIIKSLRDFMLFRFSASEEELDKTKIVKETMEKLTSTVRFMMSYGQSPSKDVIQLCIDLYIVELLELPKFQKVYKFWKSELNPVQYHEHMDSLTVAMLRPLLNDYRYERTCIALSVEPVEELYSRDLFKS